MIFGNCTVDTASSLISDLQAWVEAVRRHHGFEPTTILLSPKAAAALQSRAVLGPRTVIADRRIRRARRKAGARARRASAA